jgi:membrane protease YdiL (CAAX protease family)
MSRDRSGRMNIAALVVGMVVFGLCAHRETLVILRIAALAAVSLAVVRGITMSSEPRVLLGLCGFNSRRAAFVPLCIVLGVGLGIYYRYRQGRPLLPDALTYMCFVSAVIGLCEEVIYRGFVQGGLRRYGVIVAVLGGAVAHTAYKCSLFVLPDSSVCADILWLGIATFATGIVFGIMRERWGSLLFPVIFHVAFDVTVYADLQSLPWWL